RIVADHGIDWNVAKVSFGHQVLQRLGGLLLVVSVLVEHGPDGEEVILQDILARMQEGFVIDRHRDSDKNPDDRNDDQDYQRNRSAQSTSPNRTFHRVLSPCLSYRRYRRRAGRLPLGISRAVESFLVAAAVDIED